MFLWNCSLFFVAASWFVLFAHAQTNHVITVGQLGSFYDPPTLSAALNDTVTFLFLGPFHTVTQSSAESPCLPLPGGFDSGVLGKGTNDTVTPTPSWTLTITNASEPIWFFCEITHPTSHCGSGMVGVINPPSQQAYLSFKTLAEMVSGTPTPSPTLVLTGIGAAATGSPSSLVTTVTSTGQATVTVAPGTSSTKAHIGAILGGAVGGFFGLVLVGGGILYWLRRRRISSVPSSPTITEDSHFFRYDPGPVTRPLRPSEAFVAAKALENSLPKHEFTPDAPLVPNRRRSNPTPAPGLQTPHTHILDRQASLGSNLATPTASESTAATGMGTVNMQALANEVAAVLMRAPSGQTLNSNIAMGMHADPAEAQYQHAHMGSLVSANGHEPPAYHAEMRPPGTLTEESGVKANYNR